MKLKHICLNIMNCISILTMKENDNDNEKIKGYSK